MDQVPPGRRAAGHRPHVRLSQLAPATRTRRHGHPVQLLLDHGLGRPSGGPWRARLGEVPYRHETVLRVGDPSRRLPTPAQLVQGELRTAAESNLVDRARLLLRRCAESGIDLNARAGGPDPCQTAYEYAVVCGNTEIVDLLTQAGAETPPLDPTYQLIAACLRADRPTADRLLAADPGLVERTLRVEWWPAPVHQAAALNRPAAVRLLVSLGFPVNDPKGSPLHVAALFGSLDVVRLLVALGADPTAEIDARHGQFTPGDRTPLGWARYTRHQEVIDYLTSVGPS